MLIAVEAVVRNYIDRYRDLYTDARKQLDIGSIY